MLSEKFSLSSKSGASSKRLPWSQWYPLPIISIGISCVNTKDKNPMHENHVIWFSKQTQAIQGVQYTLGEKDFVQDHELGTRNAKWFGASLTEVPTLMYTKFLSFRIIFGITRNEGHFMVPHFSCNVLGLVQQSTSSHWKHVKPWIKEFARGRVYVFQQDSAPSRTAWMSKKFQDHVTNNIWTPCSPSLALPPWVVRQVCCRARD